MNRNNSYISFRMEKENQSLWYDKDGTFNPFNDEEVKQVPMPFNESFINTFSAVKDFGDFPLWFSASLMEKLKNNGYKMYKIISSDIIVLETQVLIPKNSIINKEEIIFNSQY